MPNLSKGSGKEAAGDNQVKRIVRKAAPWYGGVVTIYATAHGIHGFLQGAGLLKVPFQDLIFNLCLMAGIVGLFAAIFGGLATLLGAIAGEIGGVLVGILGFESVDPELFSKRVVWLFGILGAAGFGGWLLFELASDPRDFTQAPKYDGLEWFLAALGAAVLVATYVFFGKKLLDQLKTVKTELEKNA